MARHTLSVLVENKPGVLARVSGLFARRGFNIHSLAVGPTEREEVSRMTIVVNVEDKPLEQVVKQLNKLVNVLKIVELEKDQSVERELLLIKVKADQQSRAPIIEMATIFRAKIVDVSPNALTIEATGSPDKLHALTDLLHQFGVREMVRTGLVALARGDRGMMDRTLRLERAAGA
jgi:acetolactate synthase-1/3 small subunit